MTRGVLSLRLVDTHFVQVANIIIRGAWDSLGMAIVPSSIPAPRVPNSLGT